MARVVAKEVIYKAGTGEREDRMAGHAVLSVEMCKLIFEDDNVGDLRAITSIVETREEEINEARIKDPFGSFSM